MSVGVEVDFWFRPQDRNPRVISGVLAHKFRSIDSGRKRTSWIGPLKDGNWTEREIDIALYEHRSAETNQKNRKGKNRQLSGLREPFDRCDHSDTHKNRSHG